MNEPERERHRIALTLFDELVDLPEAQRVARLEARCAGDAPLRSLLESMLKADRETVEPLLKIAARAGESLRAEAAQDQSILGRQIGAWRITAMLGHGGMGAVYEVQRADAAYSQRAALKLIRTASDSPTARARFERERQTLARLQHPNIAMLLDGGISSDGDPYFVMEYVDGQPIGVWCDEHRLDLRQRVELFAQVLQAVGYAHRNLVVHRDLKPSNLMVDRSGRVKLLDFGIAKQLEGSLGTPVVQVPPRRSARGHHRRKDLQGSGPAETINASLAQRNQHELDEAADGARHAQRRSACVRRSKA